MIVTMKKVHILSLTDKKERVVADLKELGLLHVTQKQVNSPKIEAVQQTMAQRRKAQVVLSLVESKEVPPEITGIQDLNGMVETLIQLGDEIKHLKDQADKIVKEQTRLEPWGDFDPKALGELVQSGIQLTLLAVPLQDLKKIPTTIEYMLCSKNKVKAFLIVFGDSQAVLGMGEALVLPELSLSELQVQLDSLKESINQRLLKLKSLRGLNQVIEDNYKVLEAELEEAIVGASLDDNEGVSIVDGFIPADKQDDIRTWAKNNGWGLVLDDPSSDDQVPTLLKNPAPVRMLYPILDFLGTVPGYKERDISHWFLAFLTVFFAMIIGDAVYGLLLLALGIGFGIKIKLSGKKAPLFIPLLITFSSATVIWGAMTGTWLGLSDTLLPEFIKGFKVPFLTDPEMGTKNVQLVCFIMGLGHLLLAHILRFFRELKAAPHIHAFAQLGWASVLFGAFWLVLNVVLDPKLYPIPDFALWFIGGGMGVVFVFEKQEQGVNFFKGILNALGNVITTALSGISAFGDIISYIRLFAVGLAGLAIAQSFNAMAQGSFASGDIGGIITGALIMFAGHTLNLIMGALSVVVHGIRLNMLEYSSHIGLEWTGFSYKPFKQEA